MQPSSTVSVFVRTTICQKDWCVSFSARALQAASANATSVWRNARHALFGRKTTESGSSRVDGALESLTGAVGSGVTLHVAPFFPRWRNDLRNGQATTFFSMAANPTLFPQEICCQTVRRLGSSNILSSSLCSATIESTEF